MATLSERDQKAIEFLNERMRVRDMNLSDIIMRARQAQHDHERRYDVQLSLIPFTEPEIEWATEEEYRREWHDCIDEDWRLWILAHYGPTG